MSSGENVSFVNFPKDPLIRKQWIHAIRRDEGKDFVITARTKEEDTCKTPDLKRQISELEEELKQAES